jgi:hypothetical protein
MRSQQSGIGAGISLAKTPRKRRGLKIRKKKFLL